MNQSRYDMYVKLGKEAATEVNEGNPSQAELQYKKLRCSESGWHQHFEKRDGDAMAAEVAFNVGYNSVRL